MLGCSKPKTFTARECGSWQINDIMTLADLKAPASGFLDNKEQFHFNVTVSAQVTILQLLSVSDHIMTD